ncbi:GNAT family N-acetyltransferase [Robbsia andropogonis]|uniref:GNAT family N-acetyltransferase n=1 Tax=Robbsia andropogonis TaxID=28092 RepID=UPI00209D8A6A|nr:GNAT family N-acetyltransferase [Robbsia andropogonis]MCP1118459.1 GNAT family N-acetyltransferase [Robbsia andropogonis]MCP1127761.1 GNAT family N-acetyltransferase [Robbsia andropogonis]
MAKQDSMSLPRDPTDTSAPMFTIVPVRTQRDLEATIALIREYVAWLGIDLSYQSFEEEMATMPGKYAPPNGELWLARHTVHGTPLACIGLRPLPDTATQGLCEVKRLFVSEHARGMGVGRAMVATAVDHARKLGYREMRLDTLTTMVAAQRLYREAGFIDIPAYYETPVENTCFMAKQL